MQRQRRESDVETKARKRLMQETKAEEQAARKRTEQAAKEQQMQAQVVKAKEQLLQRAPEMQFYEDQQSTEEKEERAMLEAARKMRQDRLAAEEEQAKIGIPGFEPEEIERAKALMTQHREVVKDMVAKPPQQLAAQVQMLAGMPLRQQLSYAAMMGESRHRLA
jgi:hypothetical protein